MARQEKSAIDSEQVQDAGISAISVRGFKSLARESRIEIRPLTILAGANSAGKSSIVQPLLLLKQTLQASYDPGPLLLNGPNTRHTSFDQLISRTLTDPDDRMLVFGVETGDDMRLTITFAPGDDQAMTIRSMITSVLVDEDTRSLRLGPGLTSEQVTEALSAFAPELRDRLENAYEGFRLTLYRDRCILWPAFESLDGNRGATMPMPFVTIPLENLHRLIHVPGLRGNPDRIYPRTASGPDFAGVFQTYVATIVADWQQADDPRKTFLERMLADLGLTGEDLDERRRRHRDRASSRTITERGIRSDRPCEHRRRRLRGFTGVASARCALDRSRRSARVYRATRVASASAGTISTGSVSGRDGPTRPQIGGGNSQFAAAAAPSDTDSKGRTRLRPGEAALVHAVILPTARPRFGVPISMGTGHSAHGPRTSETSTCTRRAPISTPWSNAVPTDGKAVRKPVGDRCGHRAFRWYVGAPGCQWRSYVSRYGVRFRIPCGHDRGYPDRVAPPSIQVLQEVAHTHVRTTACSSVGRWGRSCLARTARQRDTRCTAEHRRGRCPSHRSGNCDRSGGELGR